MLKRALSMLLALVMVFGLLPVTARAGELDNGLVYQVVDDHVEITGYYGDDMKIVIPAEIDGLPVTSIGYAAFQDNQRLTYIDLPDCVTSIGDYAFCNCISLTGIALPDGVTAIGLDAFGGCISLTRIDLPDSVASIGEDVFCFCTSLTGIYVDDQNPYFSSDDCGVLFNKEKTQIIQAPGAITDYTIPDSVVSIGNGAFKGCSSLVSISIPDSVTSIGNGAISYCTSLGSIVIPDSITSIGDNAFNGCKGLTSIDLSDNISRIQSATFSNCQSLTSISIPGNVASIRNHAFRNCISLTSIYFEGHPPHFSESAFSNVTATAYYPPNDVLWTEYAMQNYGGSLTWEMFIPADSGFVYELCEDHVEITGYYGAPMDVVIPAQIEGLPVTHIGKSAFEVCGTLASISIPDSVTSIGKFAFLHCTSLTGIDIPDSVASIDDQAFFGCTGLTGIVIPASVTSIGDAVFAYCSNLTGILVEEDNPNYSSDDQGVLFDKEKTRLIRVPGTVTDSYQIPDSVISIDACSFSRCSNLTSVSIPFGVTSIGDSAFADCPNLYRVSIPNSVTSIGDYAFADCVSLTEVSLPDSITSIGDWTFDGCPMLTSIDLPDSVSEIGCSAFYDCSGLTRIDLPDSVSLIDSEAFGSCSNLTSVYFKGDAPWIETDAFYWTTATAYYPVDNTTWTEDVMLDYGGDITWVPYNPNNPFTDVPAKSFYEDPVLWAVKNGITTGTTTDTFDPNGNCLRAQVVTFLHRAEGNPAPTSSKNPFSDVKTSDFFYDPVLWAVEKGITTGVSATRFGSYDVCNRAAVVTFLWRAAGSPAPGLTEHPFTDVPDGVFYENAVLWALENNITNGVDATHFGPTSPCNRAQVVTFLYRACH